MPCFPSEGARISGRYFARLAIACMALLARSVSADTEAEESVVQSKRDELDGGIWKTEALAAEYGKSIIAFWEAIRESENPLETFRTYSLGSVEVPKWSLNRRLPVGIFEFIHRVSASGAEYLKSYQLQTLVNRFEQEGYQLEQTDFRHAGFEIQDGGSAVSRVEFELNVSGPTHTLYRRSFRGVARIVWEQDVDENGIRAPASISFDELRQYRRTGKISFVARDWLESGISGSPYRYMVVEDVNLDGLPDILFPQENLLYQNYGKFEFDPIPLLDQAPALSVIDAALLVDLDLDGKREYVICMRGIGIMVFEQHRKTGRYSRKPKVILERKTLFGGSALTVGDVNGDGLPDIFLGQNVEPYTRGILPLPYYDANDGLSSVLLINRGGMKFREHSVKSEFMPKMNRRNRTATIFDLDRDGVQDLVMNSNFGGVDVFSSWDKERFADITKQTLDSTQMFGTTHLITDFNSDGALDLFAGGVGSEVGRRLSAAGSSREGFETSEAMRPIVARGSRLWLGGSDGFSLVEDGGVFAKAGWVWSAADLDFNNDGLVDLYLNNGYISKASANDYEELFWRHDVYDNESEEPKEMLPFFIKNGPSTFLSEDKGSWAPFQKNRLLANFGEEGFVDIAYLMGVSLEVDGRAIISEDFNLDGKPDLIVVDSDSVEEQIQVKILENDMVGVGNWIGVQLRPAPGHSVIGAVARVVGDSYEAIRASARGQIRGAQNSSFLRFGIGELDSVERIEITWADGRVTRLESPAVNQYHAVGAGD